MISILIIVLIILIVVTISTQLVLTTPGSQPPEMDHVEENRTIKTIKTIKMRIPRCLFRSMNIIVPSISDQTFCIILDLNGWIYLTIDSMMFTDS